MSQVRVCVLMTATVDPRGMILTKRSIPSERLSDYKVTLSSWLKSNANLRIIFAESSAYNLEELEALINADNSVEFLSFDGQNYPVGLGKGFGEAGIIAHVMRMSSYANDLDYIVKVTGRYYIKNFANIVSSFSKRMSSGHRADIYCDLSKNLSYADSRFFMATPNFINEYLLPMRNRINDSQGLYFEHALAMAAHKAMADGLAWSPLPVVPDIVGISGTSGTIHNRTVLKRGVRQLYGYLKRRILLR